jgi:ABC-2 type transport system ATP-binding protein
MTAERPVIEVHDLCKDYPAARSLGGCLLRPWSAGRWVRALDEVSFSVSGGRIVAVVGLNGAGKTTLLKVLCNLLSPTSGRVRVAGYALPREGAAARAKIGFVPSDERSFFWRISARANLEFFAGLYDLPPRVASRRIDELLGSFGLDDRAGGHFRDYSSGMRKRLAIVRGLLHDPQVLILDEPTNSLDASWDRYLRDYVRQWVRRDRRRVVMWSTHRMEEVREVCDGVIGLVKGRLTESFKGCGGDETDELFDRLELVRGTGS